MSLRWYTFTIIGNFIHMSLQKFFFIMGIWIAILPYLGFPRSTDSILYLLSGLALMYAAYKMRRVTTLVEVNDMPSEKKSILRPRVKKEVIATVLEDMIPLSEEPVSSFNNEESGRV